MNPRLVSQDFLGPESDQIFQSCNAGIIGLGGGGSHVAQQLAHLGVGHFTPIDHDLIELKNLNRLVGGTLEDVKEKRPKVAIAERVIKAVNPAAVVEGCRSRWQEEVVRLRQCTAIIGCVDSFRERDELEKFCRRFVIPYIDIGMDVHKTARGFSIAGQAVLSSPGGICMRCLGIITDARLAEEAARYGDAGPRPQVVWINGVLASLAVGLFAQLVTPWHDTPVASACLEFDGNRHTVETNRMNALRGVRCRHYHDGEVGDPFFRLAT